MLEHENFLFQAITHKEGDKRFEVIYKQGCSMFGVDSLDHVYHLSLSFK